jgi:hypothetical protein
MVEDYVLQSRKFAIPRRRLCPVCNRQGLIESGALCNISEAYLTTNEGNEVKDDEGEDDEAPDEGPRVPNSNSLV